jgi:UDP-N-acetylglucosamine--N-acetylmuramyl-(pentapeptide) pyrophosphoryl-undecaprenol N-acetylglucosamine transferase
MGPVMVMAGGTGGHVFPALAVAEQLRAAGCEVFWLGTPQGLEARLVPERGIPVEWIPVQGLRGSGLRRLLQAPLRLALALYRAFLVIRRRRPFCALGMGGFAAGPGGLMAWLLGVPLVVHEQNRIPGLTNRWLGRLATRVFEAFPGSFPEARRAHACGNPVRPEIAALPPPRERFAGRRGPLRLLVLGGSQGARVLNERVPEALALLPAEQRPEVRHQAGPQTLEAARAAYAAADVSAAVTPFIADMADAYGWADLVVTRAGALTLSELAAAGLGALLVPFPHAVDDHQTRNAAWLVEAGAARLLPQAALDAPRLAAALGPFLEGREQALTLAEAARRLAMTEAAATVAQACLDLAPRPRETAP